MEKEYILEKEYSIGFEDFRDGYTAYQKKYVLKRSYSVMGIFLMLTVPFIFSIFKDPSNMLQYVLICICVAFAFREWYNPKKIRRLFLDTFREIKEMRCKVSIGEDFAEFSTLSDENVEKIENDVDSDLPEEMTSVTPTRVNNADDVKCLDYEKFVLLCVAGEMFYIVPKAEWSADELDTLRRAFS